MPAQLAYSHYDVAQSENDAELWTVTGYDPYFSFDLGRVFNSGYYSVYLDKSSFGGDIDRIKLYTGIDNFFREENSSTIYITAHGKDSYRGFFFSTEPFSQIRLDVELKPDQTFRLQGMTVKGVSRAVWYYNVISLLRKKRINSQLTLTYRLQQAFGIVRTRGIRGLAQWVRGARAIMPGQANALSQIPGSTGRELIRYTYTYELLSADGTVPSRRPINETDFALETPFKPLAIDNRIQKIAAIIHGFYPEILPSILNKLANIPCEIDLFISTDTSSKRDEIVRICSDWKKGSTEVRIFPNRGRDIAPKIVGFRDIYASYEIFFHCHTKKSPHGGEGLADWRDYLLDNMVGTPDVAASNLTLFNDPHVGIVFPQHLFELRGILNWGYDYDIAQNLLKSIGVTLDKNLVLEFPSGSVFLGRSAAIKPLLDLGLTFDDFPEEAGQIDGTLAHAIERSMLFIAESQGFEWLKTVQRHLYPLRSTVLPVRAVEDIARHRLLVFQPCLARADGGIRPSERVIPETRPIRPYPSRSERPRLNLLVPTINQHQTFGGVATALRTFKELKVQLGNAFDYRIVTTDAPIERKSQALYEDATFFDLAPHDDDCSHAVVDAFDRTRGALNIRKNDIFIATAWWTAGFASEFQEYQTKIFKNKISFVYLIQDDEPYFYGWSSRFSLAENTYSSQSNTIAVVNSEELFLEMTNKHDFIEMLYLPYQMNKDIKMSIQAGERDRTIIFYGRPNVSRNAFELILDGLHLWQQRNPNLASKWRILSLGEDYPSDWLYPVMNVQIIGKASLRRYAQILSTASVGISLMISPHPSYPPLEMAEAGVLTISNNYGVKKLENRFKNIIALEFISPAAIADALDKAVEQIESGAFSMRQGHREAFADLAKESEYTPARLANLIRAEINRSPINRT